MERNPKALKGDIIRTDRVLFEFDVVERSRQAGRLSYGARQALSGNYFWQSLYSVAHQLLRTPRVARTTQNLVDLRMSQFKGTPCEGTRPTRAFLIVG